MIDGSVHFNSGFVGCIVLLMVILAFWNSFISLYFTARVETSGSSEMLMTPTVHSVLQPRRL